MSALQYGAPLYQSSVDGAALTNSTTATSLLPSGAGNPKYTLPSGLLKGAGDQLRFTAAGRISTLVTTPGTLTLELRLGSVVIATGGTMVLSTTAKTNVAWYLDWLLTLRAIGGSTSSNFMHQGMFWSEAAGATTVAGEAKGIALPQSAPAVGTGFDAGAAAVFDFYATWSVANASNSILCHQAALISL